jgi:hypothetical protein
MRQPLGFARASRHEHRTEGAGSPRHDHLVGHPLIRVDVTCFNVDDDPIAVSAIGDDRLFARAIRIHRMNATGVQLENE